MASTKNSPTVETAEASDPTHQQAVNDGILRVIDTHGINVQKNRYKAMRAIAWQAFIESIGAGDFDGLVDRAIANVGDLPSGWEIEKPVKEEAVNAAPKAAPAGGEGVHEANPNAVNRCTCGEQFANKGALTRHIRRNIVPLVKEA